MRAREEEANLPREDKMLKGLSLKGHNQEWYTEIRNTQTQKDPPPFVSTSEARTHTDTSILAAQYGDLFPKYDPRRNNRLPRSRIRKRFLVALQ